MLDRTTASDVATVKRVIAISLTDVPFISLCNHTSELQLILSSSVSFCIGQAIIISKQYIAMTNSLVTKDYGMLQKEANARKWLILSILTRLLECIQSYVGKERINKHTRGNHKCWVSSLYKRENKMTPRAQYAYNCPGYDADMRTLELTKEWIRSVQSRVCSENNEMISTGSKDRAALEKMYLHVHDDLCKWYVAQRLTEFYARHGRELQAIRWPIINTERLVSGEVVYWFSVCD